MLKKISLTFMLIFLLVVPANSLEIIVFETTGWIEGTDAYMEDFNALLSPPFTYQVTFSDLSVAPDFGFEFAYLSITSTTESLGSITGFGSFNIDVEPGQLLFANVIAEAGGTANSGLFGIEIVTTSSPPAIPEPATITLLGVGLLGLAGASRKKFNRK